MYNILGFILHLIAMYFDYKIIFYNQNKTPGIMKHPIFSTFSQAAKAQSDNLLKKELIENINFLNEENSSLKKRIRSLIEKEGGKKKKGRGRPKNKKYKAQEDIESILIDKPTISSSKIKEILERKGIYISQSHIRYVTRKLKENWKNEIRREEERGELSFCSHDLQIQVYALNLNDKLDVSPFSSNFKKLSFYQDESCLYRWILISMDQRRKVSKKGFKKIENAKKNFLRFVDRGKSS